MLIFSCIPLFAMIIMCFFSFRAHVIPSFTHNLYYEAELAKSGISSYITYQEQLLQGLRDQSAQLPYDAAPQQIQDLEERYNFFLHRHDQITALYLFDEDHQLMIAADTNGLFAVSGG